MKSRRLTALISLTFFLAILSGCGSDSEKSPPAPAIKMEEASYAVPEGCFALKTNYEKDIAAAAPVGSVEDAGRLLKRLGRGEVRPWFSVESGESRNTTGISLLLPREQAENLLGRIRGKISPGIVVFLSASGAGDVNTEAEALPVEDVVEFIAAPGEDIFDILRLARTSAPNFGMNTEDLIARLRPWNDKWGLSIISAGADTLDIELGKTPADLEVFSREISAVCPDLEASPEELKREFRQSRRLYFWWD